MEKCSKGHSRRDFLKVSAAGTAGLVIGSAGNAMGKLFSGTAIKADYGPLNQWPGRCALNYNSSATNASLDADETVIKKMVDDTIKLLTEKDTVGEAWKSLFPNLTAQTKIAIKVNMFNPDYPPHPFVVVGITEGLKQVRLHLRPVPRNHPKGQSDCKTRRWRCRQH
jgi:hypothetical protein